MKRMFWLMHSPDLEFYHFLTLFSVFEKNIVIRVGEGQKRRDAHPPLLRVLLHLP